MPDSALDDTTLDGSAIPPGASLETLRLAIIFSQRDIRKVASDLARNGTLDEEDRAIMQRVVVQGETMLGMITEIKAKAEKADWFDRITGQGDAIDGSKRPWLRFLVLVLAIVVALGVLSGGAVAYWYTSDAQTARREEVEDREYALKVIAAQAAANTVVNARQSAQIDTLRALADSIGAASSQP